VPGGSEMDVMAAEHASEENVSKQVYCSVNNDEANSTCNMFHRRAAPCPQAASAVTTAGGPIKQGRRPERLITAALQHVVTSVANGASVVQGVKPLFLSKGKAQEFNQPTSDGEAVLSAVVKDVLEAVGGIAAASRQRHAAEYGGKLDSIFLPANGAKPHLDATARALFLQWIKTKAENAIKQSKSPSSKGKDRRVFVAAATPSGDELRTVPMLNLVQPREREGINLHSHQGNMRKLHWSFGAAWNSFGATQQQPIMGNS
ncbi:hypothetical protein HaLaN_05425, partial [Haematococcus lacustris]